MSSATTNERTTVSKDERPNSRLSSTELKIDTHFEEKDKKNLSTPKNIQKSLRSAANSVVKKDSSKSTSRHGVRSTDLTKSTERTQQGLSSKYATEGIKNSLIKKNDGELDNLSEDSRDVEEDKDDNSRTYCIISGNGYNIINAVMQRRQGWKEITKEELWSKMMHPNFKINLIWRPVNFNQQQYALIDEQLNKAYRYWEENKNKDRELVINHLQGHGDLTTKVGILKTLKYYYKSNPICLEKNY